MDDVQFTNDAQVIAAIGAIGAIAANVIADAIVVAEITAPASGILGAIGFTTTTTVAVPVAGVVVFAGLAGYGIYKGVQWAKNN
ncbi:hypothetical protein VB715_12645 [Crocosphaera sp. UHCC 0190]|uniref:hypothetical protein n=1 Tax=Crocosphaera sp. UHCC 0190 TaxID=3110246 RepID=UPI002B20444C|nr:hypothetical protein [Crocosphaera sp. UHCC 0190]MEA5510614.1 hypothetical protein [Crocosphaera sp. UHCC 0190]